VTFVRLSSREISPISTWRLITIKDYHMKINVNWARLHTPVSLGQEADAGDS
jgi:hypothetical protein